MDYNIVPIQPQRQDSTLEQLTDLHTVATRLGMYDAADWLWAALIKPRERTPE